MNIAFVVLHYKVASVTEECIDNLLKQKYKNYEIIVVDNCSSNGSYEKLLKKYASFNNVYFVSIEYNLGFAKANDLGYQIAKHKYNAEYIAVINNDLMIEDEDFCNKLIELGKNKKFDILGPDIINKVGAHQNPLQGCVTNQNELNKLILMTRLKLFILPIMYGAVKPKRKTDLLDNKVKYDQLENVPLHGSCLVFSKHFINNYEYPFYPETFLYGEEDILYFIAKKNELIMLFTPDIKVYHLEDVTTDSIIRNNKKKRIFELKNSLKTLKILSDLMNNRKEL